MTDYAKIAEQLKSLDDFMGKISTPDEDWRLAAGHGAAAISELLDCLDLMKDEFLRIRALAPCDEIKDLCDRALKDIRQRVPVLRQYEILDLENCVMRLLLIHITTDGYGFTPKNGKDIVDALDDFLRIPWSPVPTERYFERLREFLREYSG